MFPRLPYLEWIEGRPDVALYDLGSSDLRGDRDHDPSLVTETLADIPDPPVGATVELQLAQAYGVDPEHVLLTTGATTANLIAAATAVRLSEADEETHVLVEKPAYGPLVGSPRGVGAAVDRFLRADDGAIDPERVAAAMTPATGLVTVTNRHNPSGHLADRDALAELATAVRRENAHLLVDEVYAPYVTPDEARSGDGHAFGSDTAAGLDGVVVTGSLTKFLGFGDLRVGWLVGDPEFVDVARSIAHHVNGVAGPSRVLARRALHNIDALGSAARELLAENHDLLAAFVDDHPAVQGVVHPGCTYAFLDVEGVDGDELATAAWQDGLLVVPGRFFDDPERVRVSLGQRPETAAASLDALGELIEGLIAGDDRRTEP